LISFRALLQYLQKLIQMELSFTQALVTFAWSG
jgi:hypothetical protein